MPQRVLGGLIGRLSRPPSWLGHQGPLSRFPEYRSSCRLGKSMIETIDELIRQLLSDRSPEDHFEGCTDAEIEALRIDQGVSRLPSDYISFLKQVGRSAGPLLRGSEAFYPELLGIKEDARELVAENRANVRIDTESFVIAMHQGYQIFWFPDVSTDKPNVLMYQEGDAVSQRMWPSFADYLLGILGWSARASSSQGLCFQMPCVFAPVDVPNPPRHEQSHSIPWASSRQALVHRHSRDMSRISRCSRTRRLLASPVASEACAG